MFRVSVDLVDINIVEKCTAIRLQCCPIRLSTCNLHGQLTHQVILFKDVLRPRILNTLREMFVKIRFHNVFCPFSEA